MRPVTSETRKGRATCARLVLTCCIGALASTVCAADPAPATNLAPNPGFEEVEQGKPLHWTFDHAKTDGWGVSEDAHSGKHSVWGQLEKSSHASWWPDEIPVEPNTTYDVQAWIKVDRPASPRAVGLGVDFDTHNAPIRSALVTPGSWSAIATTVRSWPKSTTARVRLLVMGSWQGKVWFDDVSLRKSEVDWTDRFERTDLSRLRLGQGRPCVFFSRAEMEQLRHALWAKAARSSCVAEADRLAAESPFRLPDIDFADARVGRPGRLYMREEAQRVRCLGLAYQFSQDRRYAQGAKERLVAGAERIPHGGLSGGKYGYNTGYALHNMAGAYDLVCDSPVFSSADRQKIESMFRAAFAGVKLSKDVMRINNRGAICLGAMASIAFCLQDRELIEWTLNGPYGFNYHLHEGVGDDGIWAEGIGYGYMALGKPHGYSWNCGYLAVAEAAYHAGIDLYSHPRFKRIFDAPLEYAFPDFSLPANGHCAYSTSLLSRGRFYLKPWTRTRDPRYAWLISEQLQRAASGQASSLDLFLLAGANEADFSSAQAQPPPTVGSVLFGQIGHAMLRTGRDESQVCVFLDYGPFGSHGNPDKMSFSLYAHDHVLCPDGITGYRYVNTVMYECQTVGHNTVVVDERTQFPTADRTLNAWLPAPGVKIVDAEDIEAYPGVKLRRSVALTDRYVLDVFAVTSDEEHRYDWTYRNFGPLEVSPKLTSRPGTLGVTDGYQYITGVRRGPADGDWTAEWDLNEMNLVWNSSFEFQTGPAWQVIGWRIPSREWRRYVSVDTDTLRAGKQSLRIELPKGKREPVHLLAAYKRNRFRAGKTYLLEAHARTRDVRPAEGAIGLWVGEQLVGKLSGQDAVATSERWIKIGGTYNARTTNRDLVKIGLDGVDGGTVWFDDVSLRVREAGANAVRLTMLGCPGTEVITSDGAGLRPFQQALLFARRHAQDTVFACVMEPYYGQPTVQAVRRLTPASAGDRAGIEVVTNRSVDRFLVSYAPGRKTCAGLATDAVIAAVSLDRATDTLRHLCMGRGTSVAAGPWALQTAKPATLHLARSDRAYVLRVWGEYRGPVAVTAPDLAADWTVSALDSDAGAGANAKASFTGQSMRFDIADGRAYRLAGPRR